MIFDSSAFQELLLFFCFSCGSGLSLYLWCCQSQTTCAHESRDFIELLIPNALASSFICCILPHLDLKSVLGKKRRDGKTAPLQPLTTMQKVYIGRLTEKYGDDYQV